MSAYLTNLSYDGAVFETGPGLEDTCLNDLQIMEEWTDRPASAWAVQRIGVLLSKIEAYTGKIYHRNRYGKHSLSKLIPAHVLTQYANEALGFDGWSLEVMEIYVANCRSVPSKTPASDSSDERLEVLSEATVRLRLKDGTNTKASGVGSATASTKGDSFSMSKKLAINDAFKKCFLSLETIILEHERRVSTNYYVDGLYGSHSKKP
ncbi:LAFA_0D09472g1_1 [Lachancea sp. 'fantastica']|nr:LAFA_0D09472g1_1 [Lachancea sp. 'fantastica']